MSHEYSDPRRASDPHALPDVEVFHAGQGELWTADPSLGTDEPNEPGWYWWMCLPGCMPDGDPVGPFATHGEAVADARDGAVDDDEVTP